MSRKSTNRTRVASQPKSIRIPVQIIEENPSVTTVLERVQDFLKVWAKPGPGSMTGARDLIPQIEFAKVKLRLAFGDTQPSV